MLTIFNGNNSDINDNNKLKGPSVIFVFISKHFADTNINFW